MRHTPSVVIALLIIVLALPSLRWACRSWGKAILGALAAPLVLVPLGAVSYLGVATLLRLADALLEPLGLPVSREAADMIASITAVAVVLALFAHYCREQRHVSGIATGPRLGVRLRAPRPEVFRRRFPR